MNSDVKKDITAHDGDDYGKVPALDWKDMRALKRSKYAELSSGFKTVFVLKHKTGKIAEIRGLSSVHACSMIGWRPRQVTLVSSKDVEEQPQAEAAPNA